MVITLLVQPIGAVHRGCQEEICNPPNDRVRERLLLARAMELDGSNRACDELAEG